MMTRSSYRHLTSLILTFLVQGTFAANIIVNTTTDDKNAGDGKCTLREAINNANTDSDTTSQDCKKGSGSDVIYLTSLSGQIFLDLYKELKVTSNIQFKGPGANNLTVDGNDYSRIFKIESMAQVMIEGLTIANGRIEEECSDYDSVQLIEGGGIYNAGILTIKNSVFLENHAKCEVPYASIAEGGAIFNSGTLTISDSTFLNNSAIAVSSWSTYVCQGEEGSGGGIYNSGTLYVENSTFSNNLAAGSYCYSDFRGVYSGDGYGGGIHNAKTLTVKNSTFVKNSARGGSAEANSFESAIAGNGFGGGISSHSESVSQIINSTFSQNSVRGGDSYSKNKGSNKSGESYGGGIYINYHCEGELINNTFVGNSAKSSKATSDKGLISRGKGYGGGAASKGESFLSIKNTIITNSIGEDCYTSGGNLVSFNNLIKDGTCEPKYTGNPRLGVLRNNGGITMTHRLFVDSIARDTGDDAICAAVPVNGLDQRGAPRTGISAGNHCDIGAFELQTSDLVELTDFTATPTNEKSILFKWKTGAERYSAGFYLWQAEPLEENCEQFTHEIKLTDKAIPSQGDENSGAYYEYRYEGPVNASNSCYGLEERETSGKRNFYIIGPGIEKWKTFSVE